MEIEDIIYSLRMRVADYRRMNWRLKQISTHVAAVDIVLALTELGIRDKRTISQEEKKWFCAGLYLHYVFDSSEWEDIADYFDQIVDYVESKKYFKFN